MAVIICAYTERRWNDVIASYGSLTSQTPSPDEIIVVIDHNQALLERFRRRFPDAVVLANTGPEGLSGARNTGVEASSADVILFLDDDASAGPGWVEAMTAPFENPTVQGVAGWANPNWDEPGRPFMTGLLDTVRGDLGGIQRSAAVSSGLFATTAGYVRGRVTGHRNVESIAPSLRRVGGTAAQYETEPTDVRGAA